MKKFRFSLDSLFKVLISIIIAAYLPWVYMGFNVLMGQSIMMFIIGLISGHLYIFLKDIVPVSHQYNFLRTPAFLYTLKTKI